MAGVRRNEYGHSHFRLLLFALLSALVLVLVLGDTSALIVL